MKKECWFCKSKTPEAIAWVMVNDIIEDRDEYSFALQERRFVKFVFDLFESLRLALYTLSLVEAVCPDHSPLSYPLRGQIMSMIKERYCDVCQYHGKPHCSLYTTAEKAAKLLNAEGLCKQCDGIGLRDTDRYTQEQLDLLRYLRWCEVGTDADIGMNHAETGYRSLYVMARERRAARIATRLSALGEDWVLLAFPEWRGRRVPALPSSP